MVVVPLSGLGTGYSVVALNHGSLTGALYLTELGASRNNDTSASLRLNAGTGCQDAAASPPKAGNALTIIVSTLIRSRKI